MKIIKNRKAFHEYFIIDTYEAGIVLVGTEIKSIRQGKINFKDSYAKIDDNNEVWLENMHISIYDKGTHFNHKPERSRKLLLSKREIKKLKQKVDEKGMTLVPTDLHITENGLAKISLGLAKGKHTYDKRDTLQKKDMKRDLERKLKSY